MFIPNIIERISLRLDQEGASAIVVGGAVRDHFLGLPVKDYDIEVYGLRDLSALEEILSEFGSVNLVGKSFGVLKFVHNGEEYDFSFPRLESKIAKGHRGFDVSVNGSLDFETAARRRDFTVNALGYRVVERDFLDPFKGLDDLNEKKLRHIASDSFMEDPLRVYRAIQFASRFEFTLAEETEQLCRQMVAEEQLSELPKERVYAEWKKLLLKSKKPSLGFELMKRVGVLKYFPELEAIIAVPQSPRYHPEGDVWVHTMMSLDAMVSELEMKSGELGVDGNGFDEKKRLKLLFAILCHDLGKATTTTVDDKGHIHSIGHERAGVALTRSLLYRLSDETDFVESLLPLVEHHLKPSQFYKGGAKNPAIRRLATQVTIEELVLVAKADFLGRTTEEAQRGRYAAGEWLLEKAKHLQVKEKPLANLLQGRDLIALGLTPSPEFRTILDTIYELQMDGLLSSKSEALAYVRKKLL